MPEVMSQPQILDFLWLPVSFLVVMRGEKGWEPGEAPLRRKRHRYASHSHWLRPIDGQSPRSGHWAVGRENPREIWDWGEGVGRGL